MSTESSQPVHPILLKLQFILANVESAHQLKPIFKMKDCEEFLKVMTTLTTFFTPVENGSLTPYEDEVEKLAEQEEVDALVGLTHFCELQNSTGIFSISGAVMILHALEEIQEALNALKSPTLKFKELKESVKHGKSKK